MGLATCHTPVKHREYNEDLMFAVSDFYQHLSRYIHQDGKSDPVVETTEYDGRLSKDEINKLAEDSQRIEVLHCIFM